MVTFRGEALHALGGLWMKSDTDGIRHSSRPGRSAQLSLASPGQGVDQVRAKHLHTPRELGMNGTGLVYLERARRLLDLERAAGGVDEAQRVLEKLREQLEPILGP